MNVGAGASGRLGDTAVGALGTVPAHIAAAYTRPGGAVGGTEGGAEGRAGAGRGREGAAGQSAGSGKGRDDTHSHTHIKYHT